MKNLSQELIDISRYCAQRDWCPARGGNFSVRLDKEKVAITASGGNKGNLARTDILAVDLSGQPLNTTRASSAETLLHLALYKLDPEINAVLHVHTVANTVLSMHTQAPTLILRNYEMLKPFRGVTTHETEIKIPIFSNSQDMTLLAQQITEIYPTLENCYAFLVRGHGCYTWGNSIEDAKRHLEALEFLLSCELEWLRLRRD